MFKFHQRGLLQGCHKVRLGSPDVSQGEHLLIKKKKGNINLCLCVFFICEVKQTAPYLWWILNLRPILTGFGG